jgi:hypothetical protein
MVPVPEEEWNELPIQDRARAYKGTWFLSIGVNLETSDWRLNVLASHGPENVAYMVAYVSEEGMQESDGAKSKQAPLLRETS